MRRQRPRRRVGPPPALSSANATINERSTHSTFRRIIQPERPLTLIVALHGGYGQGSEYVWTWLRPARSRGYAILAPKSLDVTWDMTVPSLDTRSVTRMLDEVTAEYSIDSARVYLSGLSDGGIFTYILGLERERELFRGLPVLVRLAPCILAVDQMRSEGRWARTRRSWSYTACTTLSFRSPSRARPATCCSRSATT